MGVMATDVRDDGEDLEGQDQAADIDFGDDSADGMEDGDGRAGHGGGQVTTMMDRNKEFVWMKEWPPEESTDLINLQQPKSQNIISRTYHFAAGAPTASRAGGRRIHIGVFMMS